MIRISTNLNQSTEKMLQYPTSKDNFV